MNEKILVKKALESLSLKWDGEDECSKQVLENCINDSKISLNEVKDNIQELSDLIMSLKDLIPILEDRIATFNTILHQIDIEEYKFLNKGKDVQIY